MLFAVKRTTVAASDGDVDEAFFIAGTGRACETRDAQRDVGFRALKCTFRHRAGNDLRHRVIMLEQAGLNP
jgi:hypothetical protein